MEKIGDVFMGNNEQSACLCCLLLRRTGWK